MRQLLITILAWGLLFAAVITKAAVAETAGKESAEEIANVNTSQDITLDAKPIAKKPRLRFRSKSGVPKTCSVSGLGEKEIRQAEQKRLKAQQQTKSSNDNSHNETKERGDDQND